MFYVGSTGGNNNSMTIKNGASLLVSCIEIGYEGSNNNKLRVDGSSTTVTNDYLDLGYSSSGSSGNSMVISNGAKVINTCASYDSTIGYSTGSNNNHVAVNGAGSLWKIGYNSLSSDCLAIGSSSTGNSLSIDNGGLVMLGDSSSAGLTIEMGNYVQFSNGLLAIGGNVDIETLLNGKVMIWDGSAYVPASSTTDIYYSYCTSVSDVNTFLTTYGLSGYGYDADSLVNYTLTTGGLAGAPEPASTALLGAAGVMGFVLLRRKLAKR